MKVWSRNYNSSLKKSADRTSQECILNETGSLRGVVVNGLDVIILAFELPNKPKGARNLGGMPTKRETKIRANFSMAEKGRAVAYLIRIEW